LKEEGNFEANKKYFQAEIMILLEMYMYIFKNIKNNGDCFKKKKQE
jgi:hypothetical protein